MKREQRFVPHRVLDLSSENGMLYGKIISDLADAVKVERPGGDAKINGAIIPGCGLNSRSITYRIYDSGCR